MIKSRRKVGKVVPCLRICLVEGGCLGIWQYCWFQWETKESNNLRSYL